MIETIQKHGFRKRLFQIYFSFWVIINKWFFDRTNLIKRSMEQKQVETKVIAILRDILDLNNLTIKTKYSLKQLGLDSMDKHDLLMEVAKEFKIDYEMLDQNFIYDLTIEGFCKCIENEIANIDAND
jgi:acyl carrier protein